jgi:cobalt-zinc-cadmium efflux system outer membrane protein
MVTLRSCLQIPSAHGAAAILAILFAALTAPSVALAAEPAEALPRLTLADAVATFRQHSFDLLVANVAVDSARADERVAGAVANPNASFSIGKAFNYDASCAGCSAVLWSASLSDQGALSSILAGKRHLRLDVAKAALEAAKMSRDDAARTLEFALKVQYLETALAQASTVLMRQAAEAAAQTADLVGVRYRAGAVSEADLAKAEAAKLEADQVVDTSVQAVRVAKASLVFLLGTRGPGTDFEVEADILRRRAPATVASLTREDLLRSALEFRPDLRAAMMREQQAQAAIAANKRERFPDIAILVDYTQQGTGQLALQPPTLSFGVSLPVPVFYQLQGEVARAEADRRAQSLLLSKTRAQVVADIETALASFVGASRRIERMESKLLERAARARDLVLVQYQKGAASLLELLDAQRTFYTVNAEYLGDSEDYWSSIFALEQAVGKELAR